MTRTQTTQTKNYEPKSQIIDDLFFSHTRALTKCQDFVRIV